jgi:tetratricopeptide (TPR) repeat protein
MCTARSELEQIYRGQFLLEAVIAQPLNPERRIDLALSVFHDSGPDAALVELDKTPPLARNGDYYLLRAQLLDTLGKPQEAAEALNRGIELSPTRPDLYIQAALFLAKHHRYQHMVSFLGKAVQVLPGNPQLQLTRAIGLAILHQDGPATAILT